MIGFYICGYASNMWYVGVLYLLKDDFVTMATYRYIPGMFERFWWIMYRRRSLGIFSFYTISDTDFTAFVLSLLLIGVFLFSIRWIWNGYLVPSSTINWMSLEGCCYYLEKVSVELMVDVYKQSYGFSFKCSSMTNNVRMYCCILFILTLIHYCIMHFILPSWVLKRPIKITWYCLYPNKQSHIGCFIPSNTIGFTV